MNRPKTSGVNIDFVLYLGDPDEDATVTSERAIAEFDRHHEKLDFGGGLYGAVVIRQNGKELAPRRPDPILRLITTLVRSLPYVIDGEPESALQSESDQGFLFEPSQGRVQISVFKGSDAFDPEEYIVEGVSMSLEEFGEQLIEMGDRIIALLERHDPEHYDSDDYAKSMIELLDVAKGAFRSYRLETERGLRP